MKKLFAALLLFILCIGTASAQKYLEMMRDPTVNFYDVKKEAEKYFAEHPKGKGSGYKPYKRWEWLTEQRVFPSGSREWMLQEKQNFVKEKQLLLRQKAGARTTSVNGNWQLSGPTNGNDFWGAGRVNCLVTDRNNANIMYCGAATGGIWKSTDGGSNWVPKGDFNQNLGVSAIAIDPSNSNIIYVGTGDYDGGAAQSYGLIKSTDAGNTWTITGMTFTYTQLAQISGISVNPGAAAQLVVTTNQGVYYSSNSGASFTQKVAGNFSDLVRHPTNNAIVYASNLDGPTIYKSTDGGNTWATAMSGIGTGGNKILLAVTPAAPNNVYAANVRYNNTIQGFYVSTNSGTSYTLKTSTMNIADIVQIGYNDCLTVSSTNANTIIFGAVHLGRSTDGGTTWTQITQWDDPHCDHHWLHYTAAGVLYNGNDGGIWKSTNNGTSWTRCNGGLTAEQYYRFGQNRTTPDVVLAGSQDNGFHYKSGGIWKQGLGGDGMEAIVDYNNPNTMVGLGYGGSLLKSTNGGVNWDYLSDAASGIPLGNGAWVTPIVIDPANSNTYYMGFADVWKSTNGCLNWTKISNNAFGGGNLDQIAVAPSNNQVIYVTVADRIYKTTNGGTSWSANLNGTVASSAVITSIVVAPTNPSEVWITKSGYASGQKVYRSTNGGTNWTNMSLNLPNLPFNTLVVQGDAAGGIYVGGDEGVFYKNNSLTNWIPFDTGLPNVIVNDMSIYAPTSKLRICTYGRGVWESDLYSPSSDTQAPTVPASLTSSNVTSTSVNLSWNASTDNVSVVGYDVLQNGATIKTVTSTTTSMTGLASSTQYSFTVKAKDAAGNLSAASNTVTATTTASTNPSNIAPLASSVTTSYVSPWETLEAVRDGLTPASSADNSNGAYGNWNNPNSLQWVQYDWPTNYILSKVELYWYDDAGGVLTPTTAYLESWNGTAWVNVGTIPKVKNAFNTLNIANVSTKRIRVMMLNTTQSTGIVEWRAWGLTTGAKTSLAENSIPKPYSIHPNPVTDIVHIALTDPQPAELVITDSQGKQVHRTTFNGKYEIHKATLGSPGLYIVRITSADQQYEEKILVQ